MVDPTEKQRVNFDQRRFDRLVDGELSPAEYRSLLAALDDEPEGWKQCALAFLEAQALAGELGDLCSAVRSENAAPIKESLACRTHAGNLSPTSSQWPGQLRSLLAIAASFIAVFCVGLAAPRIWSLVQQEWPLAGNLSKPPALANGSFPKSSPTGEVRPREIGNLRLVMDGIDAEDREAGHVPVYEVVGDVEQLLASERPALAPELIDLLRQMGYHVQREQQYYPAPLDDGRQIIVPVENYHITPVGRRY